MNNKNIPNKDWWNNNPMTYEDWDLSKDIRASLNADKFRAVTGYVVPEWPELIRMMHTYK